MQENIKITNIVKDEPQARLYWYFHEFGTDTVPEGMTKTSQPVTVWYRADRDVVPTGGTSSTYTFYPGDTETSYTFEFMDEAGNTGRITATLPVDFVGEPKPEDVPPEYEIFIYAKKNGRDEFRADTTATSLEDAIAAAGYVQGYSFDINVTEDSPWKIVILPGRDADTSGITYSGSVTAEPDGVALDRNRITVTKAAAFTVAIVDKFNNISQFTIDVGRFLDNTPPAAAVNKVYDSFNTANVLVELTDTSDDGTDTGKVTLLSPAGLEATSDGKYYFRFTKNGSLTITFMDSAGNRGSKTITVDWIDNTEPYATVKWMPCFEYEDGDTDDRKPPNKLTNGDVTATVSYNKMVVISASYSFNGETWTPVTNNSNEFFTLKVTSDTAVVTFRQGGIKIRLEAAALNGKTQTTVLELDDVIIKTPPTISKKVVYNYRDGFSKPVSATITLTPTSIDVFCAESPTPGMVIKKDTDIVFTVRQKGEYTYHFDDVVGNRTTVTVNVEKDMDRTPPEVTVDTGSGSVTGGNVTVSITVDEDAELTVTGADGVVFSGTVSGDSRVKEITISENGSYEVTAVDMAGNSTTSVFTVGNIDKIAPTIAFETVTLNIREGSTANVLRAMLDEGVKVNDNKSNANKIDVSYDITGVNLAKPGVYEVTYTAEDEAGNTRNATRFVRVYSKDELEVLVNGIKTFRDGTTTVKSKNIRISVTNPLGDEPYTVYIKKGIVYEGQMKYGYSIVRPDAGGSFTVTSDDCFYTLYIVTQSRQTYLTRIYVARGTEER